MTGEQTFALTLDDAEPDDFAAIIGGLTLVQLQAINLGQMGRDVEGRLDQVSDVMTRLLVENREAARHLLIEADVAEQMDVDLPPDLLDELGLKKAGSGVMDAEATDIDVE